MTLWVSSFLFDDFGTKLPFDRSIEDVLFAQIVSKLDACAGECVCRTLTSTFGGTPVARVPDIIPVTDLRQDAAAALKRARQSRQPVVITQRGRAAAVLVSIEAFEHAEHERQILHLLAKGEREIAAGRGFDLDSVLAEADEILAKG